MQERSEAAGLKEALCSGLCLLAEQLLAAADNPNECEAECEALLTKAKQQNPKSPEPLQVCASHTEFNGKPQQLLIFLLAELHSEPNTSIDIIPLTIDMLRSATQSDLYIVHVEGI